MKTTTLSRKAKMAIKKYGVEKCLQAYIRYDNGSNGARTIADDMDVTTNQADSMINAGREIEAVRKSLIKSK